MLTTGLPTGGGTGAPTVTVTDRLALPLEPSQLNVKVLVAVKGPIVSLPAVVLVPNQAPEAIQVVTLLDDQESVVDPLFATEAGLAEIDTVGVSGGGGDGGGGGWPNGEPSPPPAPPPQAVSKTMT